MTIRPYSPSDAPALLELLRLNTPHYFAESEKTDFMEYLANHIDSYFVIKLDDKIVGGGGFNRTPDGIKGALSWDILHPDAQGRGIGSELVKFRIAEMQKLGVTEIGVRTSQHVFQFYEKMGFKLKNPVVKNYWAEGFDLYDMEIDKKA